MGLNILNCIECGKHARRYKSGKCNTCYERFRTSSKPKISLNCKNCGPVLGRKLTNGLCNKCYSIGRDPTSSCECVSCGDMKTNIFVKGLCQACYSDKRRKNNPKIYLKSRTKNKINIAENGRRWKRDNPGKRKAIYAKRRVAKLNSMPKWLDHKFIIDVYKKCPSGKVVDHIIPLQGKNVCGLHVPWNLQYLTPVENGKKTNKFDGTSNNNGWRVE